MKKIITTISFLIFLGAVNFVSAQTEDDITVNGETVYLAVENMPEYPGGIEALKKDLTENTKYPKEARENNIQGAVFVQFIVLKSGKIGKTKIVKGVSELLDKEAERVVKLLKDFKPAEKNGKKVNVWLTLPIIFSLKD